jgi:hypothetical protein
MMSFAETVAPAEAMSVSILKRSPIGSNLEDYGVLSDGVLIDRIFLSPTAPDSRPWMWRLAYGYYEDRTNSWVRADARDGRVHQELAPRIARR